MKNYTSQTDFSKYKTRSDINLMSRSQHPFNTLKSTEQTNHRHKPAIQLKSDHMLHRKTCTRHQSRHQQNRHKQHHRRSDRQINHFRSPGQKRQQQSQFKSPDNSLHPDMNSSIRHLKSEQQSTFNTNPGQVQTVIRSLHSLQSQFKIQTINYIAEVQPQHKFYNTSFEVIPTGYTLDKSCTNRHSHQMSRIQTQILQYNIRIQTNSTTDNPDNS